jgi:hypothetical protein
LLTAFFDVVENKHKAGAASGPTPSLNILEAIKLPIFT